MTKSLARWLSPVLTLVIASACTAGGDPSKPQDAKSTAETKPTPEPEPAAETKVSVASVQMIQDCPDEEPAEQAKPALSEERAMPAPGAAAHPGDGPGTFRQPCDQSTVQLALETKGDAPVAVEVKAVRILSKGKVVGTLETRKPKIWTNNTYEPWDQTVVPGTPTKASYKLSMPSWSDVEQSIGESSFGHMFTLELDVAIDGDVQTVSSPEFPREEPHVIVT